jgi:PKHD-type hydroxylase
MRQPSGDAGGALIDQSGGPNRTIAPLRLMSEFSPAECEAIIAIGRSLTLAAGQMYTPVEGRRRSMVGFIPKTAANQWLVDRMSALVRLANRDFGFDVDAMTPILQFAEYSEGGKIEWHSDYDQVGVNPRKISVSVQLTDAQDYDGGELEFFPVGELRWSKRRGTAIVFPSFCQHRVAPVTRGVRHSLVAWFSGPAFR